MKKVTIIIKDKSKEDTYHLNVEDKDIDTFLKVVGVFNKE